MINGNVETRVAALETQMQEIRDLLQQVAQLQVQSATNLEETRRVAERGLQIAESNARSIQAWEVLIAQNRDEAEEERSRLAVRLSELEQANRENIQQHFHFQERFDRTLAEIQQIWRRLAG